MAAKDDKGLERIGASLAAIIKPHHKPLSRIKERLVSMPLDEERAA